MKNKLNLTAKTTSKLTLRKSLVYAAAGLGIVAVLFTGAFLYFNLGNSEEAVAGNPGYSSRDNQQGLWSDSNTWIREGWVTAPVPERGQGGITIDIYGVVVDEVSDRNNIFNFNGGSTLNVHDTLLIKGNFTASGGTTVNINSTGVLIVFGNFKVSTHNVVNNGRLVVTGDMEATGGGRLSNNTNGLYVYGNTIKPQWESNFHGNSFKNENALKNDYDSYKPHENLYEFVGNGGIIPLPIVLADFQASITGSQTVQVEWSTFAEKNNDFFTVERSADGKNFEVLTTVDGAGNSNKKSHYSFEDKQPLAGYNYYRLKQTDFNGDYEYFKIVAVNNSQSKDKLSAKAVYINSAWPNPFTDHLNITFDAAGDGELEVLIQNVLGEVVHKTLFPFYYGENTYAFDHTTGLKPGIYFVTLGESGKKLMTQKVIKI